MDDECIEELGRPISQMKVTELRDELNKRALSKSGNKKELIDRLRADIHRQPPQKSDAINLEQLPGQQQTGVAQPYVGQIDVGSQQQIAHQLNSMYPQQAQMPTSIPSQYQHLPQQMQQQIIAEIQNNYQASIDNMQQQAQQQLVENVVVQQLQTSHQPPIDMRVPQSTVESESKQEELQSLDLSSSTSAQVKQADESSEDQTGHSKQDAPKDLITVVRAQSEKPDNGTVGELRKETLISAEACDTSQENQDSRASEEKKYPISSESVESSTADDFLAQTVEVNEETSANDSKISAQDTEEPQVAFQAPISLKRGVSDPKNSTSGREKRRKWSSKQDGGQITGEAQATAMSGGISSQRLQELIEVSPPEPRSAKPTSTPEVVSQTQDSKNETDVLEEGQILDTSGDSAEIIKTEGTDPIEAKTPPKVDLESKKDPEPEQKHQQEREPSKVLLIQNLVRPYTINSLKDVLSQHGSIVEDKFWTDKVKSKCCVVYESIEVAIQTKESLNGQQWPLSNPKTLTVTYSTEEELLQYQKSDVAKPVEPISTLEKTENGGGDQGGSKSMVDRLGEKVNERERASEAIKKRLGEKITTDIEAKTGSVNRDGDASQSQELDDLFRKTKSVPHLFWLPLTDDQAEIKAKARIQRDDRAREVVKSRRSPPRYRSQTRRSPRNRSPPRRRSPQRYRSPIRQRSPIGRSPPPRHRSPLRRRSPVPVQRSPGPARRSPNRRSPGLIRRSPGLIRRSPGPIRRSPGPTRRSPLLIRRSPGLIRRSPGPIRRSPGPIRRSPGPIRRSPGLIRRSPGPIRRSPGPIRRSPGPIRRSPGPIRRSPGPIRRSPGPIRRSPGPIRRSPGPIRRSPGLLRRSPPPMRGVSPLRRSPMRRRSPIRRKSPGRYISPEQSPIGYGSDLKRTQRSDRLR